MAVVMAKVAALYVRADSIYKSMPGVDSWDKGRGAERYAGPWPVVAHPPCRAWGRLRHFAVPEPGEKQLAICAVQAVQKFGGVLEHPEGSTLWRAALLPRPGEPADEFGGWTISVDQVDWGHKARKRTWLYVCGLERKRLPGWTAALFPPTHTVGSGALWGGLKNLHKADRERTPQAFAEWLVEVAKRCGA